MARYVVGSPGVVISIFFLFSLPRVIQVLLLGFDELPLNGFLYFYSATITNKDSK